MRRPRPRTRRSSLPLTPEDTFRLLVALLVAVFLLGGSSRHDIESLAWLRPLAAVAAAVGVLGLDRATVRTYRTPFLLLAGLAAIMVLQLIPLPPSLWSHLPSREAIVRLDDALGLAGTWRPISLSPMKTANALASLVVPFAVLVLFCRVTPARQRDVLVTLVAIATAGALLGVLQLLAGPGTGLHYYAITHDGAAVGFFANRNHHTAFMAATMLIALHLALARGHRDLLTIACFAAALLMFAAVVGNISRGGLLSAMVALVLVPLVIPGGSGAPADGSRGRRGTPRWIKLGLIALPVLGVFALLALGQRSPALARLMSDAGSEDLRAQILPTLLAMARDFQPWGAGFGAFEYAYRMREPAELLLPQYVNNAHNDWLQLAIEGGVAALAVAALAAAAAARRLVGLVRAGPDGDAEARARAWLGFAMLAVLGFASLFDYGYGYGTRPKDART